MDYDDAAAILRPRPAVALDAWRTLVEANEAQAERLQPGRAESDTWGEISGAFPPAQRRTRAPIQPLVEAHTEPDDTWIDIGAGAGAYAIPLASRVARVIAIEPSPGMSRLLQQVVAEDGATNIEVIPGLRWPPPPDASVPQADVTFSAHVIYFVADIGGFLDAMERHARRRCVIACGDIPGSTPAPDLWNGLHDEPYAQGPGLPELLAVLHARGAAVELHTVSQPAPRPGDTDPGATSLDEAMAMERHRCFVPHGDAPADRDVAAGSDDRLRELLIEHYGNPDGSIRTRPAIRRVGVVSWEPPPQA